LKKTPILLGLLDMLSFEHPERSYPALAALTKRNPTAYMAAGGGFDASPAAYLSDLGMSFLLTARTVDLPALRSLFPDVGEGMYGADCGESLSKLAQALSQGIDSGKFDVIVFAVFGEPGPDEFDPFISRVCSLAASEGCIALFSSRFPAADVNSFPLVVTGADIRLRPGKASGLFPTIFDLMGLNPPSGDLEPSLIAK
jgi:hypothetical protein